MNCPPLCIIQARYNSTRLPGKMLLDLGGETLIERAWRIACQAFGSPNCVIAAPVADRDGPLGEEIGRIGARVQWAIGDETDVLGRFYAVAHTYRWHPLSVIVRYTPDDPWKNVESLHCVAGGMRVPVEFGGEAFTLSQLDMACANADEREHISHALFQFPAPAIATTWFYEFGCTIATIDTQQDYEVARAWMDAAGKVP